jgi:hypothetical protein
VLTDDQFRFVVEVLEGATIDVGWDGDGGVEDARDDVRRRVRGLRAAEPGARYGELCLRARVAWLREHLAGLTREGG